MQLTFDTTPGVNSLSVDNPGNCSAPATPQGNNNDGEPAVDAPIGRVLKARPDYRGDTATYPKKGLWSKAIFLPKHSAF